LKFGFCQTNYRAYVTYRGQRCVWFFGTSLTTPWVAVPRYWCKLPWHHDRLTIEASWQGERCECYRLRTAGKWGAARVDLTGTDEPTGVLDGFTDAEQTAVVLTHPLAGYYRRRDGRLGGYAVWHRRLEL